MAKNDKLKNDKPWIMKYSHGQTIGQSLERIFDAVLGMEKPDAILNIETHLFNTMIHSETCDFEFDIGKSLWLNKSRWTRLINEYINRKSMDIFIEQSQTIYSNNARDGASTIFHFRQPVRSPRKHRWGGCLGMLVYHGSYHNQPTLTMYSRTCYLGYISFLDAAIAHVVSKKITGWDPEAKEYPISFRWHIATAQVHHFKSLPYIYSRPEHMELLEELVNTRAYGKLKYTSPCLYYICDWYHKVINAWGRYGLKMLENEKYGPFKRIKRRWMEHKGYLTKNVPPSLKVSQLDF